MRTPAHANDSSGWIRQTSWLAALTLAGWLAGVRWPDALRNWGIADHRTPFLDLYAILAALDAMRAGADIYAANPFDALNRSHVYSDWWLGLRWFGLTRSNVLTLGIALVGVFGLTAWITARPRKYGETLWLTLVMISPPFMLAVKRANNDLVIFVMLAACGLTASMKSWWRPLMAMACLVLATGLKYFPAGAAIAFLWVRPIRRMPVALFAALALVSLILVSVWSQVPRGRFVVDSGVYAMGAPLLWRDLGWSDASSALPGVLLIVAMAGVFAWSGVTFGLGQKGEPRERMRAAIGCIVLLTCFSAGVNYAYRWIFIVWPAIWIWRQTHDQTVSERQRWAARVACGLIVVCLWVDGLFCLKLNRMPPIAEATLIHMQLVLRAWTQPLHWLLMGLFAGWLLEAGWATLCEWRNEYAKSCPGKFTEPKKSELANEG